MTMTEPDVRPGLTGGLIPISTWTDRGWAQDQRQVHVVDDVDDDLVVERAVVATG